VTSKDFYDWKRHPMTQIIMSQLSSRVGDIKEILSEQAGKNPPQDCYYVGYIAAFNDLIRMEYEGEEEVK
jgi:hypothetical protein